MDLEEDHRKVFVGSTDVLDGEGEELFVGRAQEVIIATPILQSEQGVAVIGPAPCRFERFAGEQRGKGHVLGTNRRHLLGHDSRDVVLNNLSERQL